MNILAIAYPTSERDEFDPVVERMEDRLNPAKNAHTGLARADALLPGHSTFSLHLKLAVLTAVHLARTFGKPLSQARATT